MRLEWIEDILAVLEMGSFAKAAERRLLTHSAFTRRIRSIEDALGCELFDRNRKPVSLKPHVLRQEKELRLAASRLYRLKSLLSDETDAEARTIRFACQHAISTTFSPHLVKEISEANDLSIKVQTTDRSTCLSQLLIGEADFAVVFESDLDPTPNFKVACETHGLGTDRLIPVCSADPAFNISAQLDAGTLPLIGYPQDIYLGELFNLAILPTLPSGLSIRHKAEAGLTFAILQYALEGIGVGWLPASMVEADLSAGRLLDLSDHLPVSELQVTILKLTETTNETLELVWGKVVG